MNFDFWKMHGTGNDFVLTESTDLDASCSALAVSRITVPSTTRSQPAALSLVIWLPKLMSPRL